MGGESDMKNMLLVLSAPVPGHEDEYHEWYTGTHLQEVIETPGFVAAQRFEFVISKDGEPPPFSHIAIYEVDGDLMEAKDALAAGSDKRVPVPDAMAVDRKSWWYRSISDRVAEESD
jgi:hypothetical protein